MRIAQIAPLYESVPPKLYGGTERVVACLSDALVQRGHEVVLFASGDSKTCAKVVPCRAREATNRRPEYAHQTQDRNRREESVPPPQ